jgi:hypothetical protein
MLSDPYAPGVRDKLSAAVKQFELNVTDAIHALADTILALPDAPIAPSDGTELCVALYEFEAVLKRTLAGLRQALGEGHMLISKAPTPAVAKATTAYPTGSHVVWLVGGLLCPHCARALRATDLDVDDHGVRLICRTCHENLLIVEPD